MTKAKAATERETIGPAATGDVARAGSIPAPTYRADIDGLRAVSILLVVLFHAGVGAFAGGFVGVDVFFVLSGYLITGLLIAEQRRMNRISLLDFYARRIRRLLPLAFLVIGTTTIVGYFLVTPLRRLDLVGDARASSLYFANWRFAGQATAYSDVQVSDSLFLHFWSLSIEEQFYLFWPVMVVAIFIACRRAGIRDFSKGLLVLVIAVVATSFVTSIVASGRGPDTYYFTYARVWELGVGAALAILVPRLRQLPRATAEAVSIAGLAMICLAALSFNETTVFPGYAALLPVLGCALLVGIGAGHETWVSRALSLRPVSYVGRTSYAWYLWHWPLIGFALLISESGEGSSASAFMILAAVVVSFALAALSHAWVEQPTRRHPLLTARPALTLGVGAVLTLTPVLLGAMMLRSDATYGSVVASATEAQTVSGGEGSGQSTQYEVTPAQAAADLAELGPADCHARFLDDAAPSNCVFGATGSPITIALVGDSHAQHWLPALDQAARDRDWTLFGWFKSSCTVIDVPLRNDRLERDYHECATWRNAILSNLRGMGGVDIVVVGDSYNYGELAVDQSGQIFGDVPSLMSAWRLGASETFDVYSEVADLVVLLRDTPWSRRNVPDCLSEDPTTPERCSFSLEGRAWLDEPYLAVELDVGGDFVVSVDMTRAICETDPCSVVTDNGMIKYRDGQHLTQTFSRSLALPLGDAIAPLLDSVSR